MDLFSVLPDEILDRTFLYLDAKSLARIGGTCKRLRDLSENELYWKYYCDEDWNIKELPNVGEMQSWKNRYIEMCRDFHRYIKCYKRVDQCWKTIRATLEVRAPAILNSLRTGGAEEKALLELEEQLGNNQKLPLEFRCSYRLCDGQSAPGNSNAELEFAGLFGSYDENDYGDYFVSWNDNPGVYVHAWHIRPSVRRHCCFCLIPIVRRSQHENHGTISLCIRDQEPSPALHSCQKPEQHASLDGRVISVGFGEMGAFVYAESFMDFLEEFARKLPTYPVVGNRILKYDFNSVGDTGSFRVTTRTAFFRERSMAMRMGNPPSADMRAHFFYRITMGMNPEASPTESCQLQTRHWVITDADENVEHVDGPGVVGNHPFMRPGAEFTWISRTSYGTKVGFMHGHFIMRRLNSGSEVTIYCPQYKMVVPEIVSI